MNSRAMCVTLCGVTLLMPLVLAQAQNAAPPSLKGVQPQNGPKRNGQPQTPASSDPRLRAPALKVKLKPPTNGRKISNPNAARRDAVIISVLQQQRQAADAEAAQMKIGIRPASRPGMPVVPSQPMSNPGSNGPNKTRASTAANIASGPAGNTSSGGRALTAIDTTVVTCSHDTTMRILKVSGDVAPATFTPDAKYNFYTISGCSFGDIGPNAQVYIYKGSTFHQKFQIQEWNENWIKLNLDPVLSGFPDLDGLTLVVQRADGKQAIKGGFKFYAARETKLLLQIPKQYFSLDKFRPNGADISSWQATYTSPSSSSVAPNFTGVSAEVSWWFTNMSPVPAGNFAPNTLTGGDDLYDFSHLPPGFVLDSAWMEWANLDCDPGTLLTSGNFGIDWYGANGIRVTWQGQNCKAPSRSGFGVQPDYFAPPPGTNYGLNVWVTGPRGVDPWKAN